MPKAGYTSFSEEKYHSAFATIMREELIPTAEDARQLADYLKVSIQAVNQYKQGQGFPKTENLVKIAQHFNCSLDYLIGLSDVKTTDAGIQAIAECTGLSEKAVERLQDLSTIENDRYRQIINAVNRLVEDEHSGNNLLWYVSEYLNDGISAVALPDFEYDEEHQRSSNTVLLLSSGIPVSDINVKDLQAIFLHLIQTALVNMKAEGSEK